MRTDLTLLSPAAILLAWATPLAAAPQDIAPLVLEGDAVAGVGNVTSIVDVAVNRLGEWLVRADTDHSDTNADEVVLDTAGLVYRENQSLAAPAGATLDSFDSLGLTDGGQTGWNLFLDGTSGTSDDSGLFLDAQLLVQEGDVLTATQVSAGTPWIGFFEARLNGARQLLTLASIDDPAIASSVDRAFVRLDLDAGGAVTAQTVLYKEGDLLPGQTFPVKDFDTAPHNHAWNVKGDVMYVVEFDGSTDDAIYYNNVLIAQENSPSPIAGRNWNFLASSELDINDKGGYVFNGRLDGDTATDWVVIANGAVIAQEGDAHPDLGGFQITSFGSAPPRIANNGDVLWYAKWNSGVSTNDEGWFVNDELIIEEGVTLVAGQVLEKLSAVQDANEISADGRYVIFEGDLTGGINGAFLYDRGAGVDETPSCYATNYQSLDYAGGVAAYGHDLVVDIDQAQSLPALIYLMIAAAPVPVPPPCGIPLPGFGELLVNFLPPDPYIVYMGIWMFVAPVEQVLPLPNNPNLVGKKLYLQGLTYDATAFLDPFKFSNGLTVTIQAK